MQLVLLRSKIHGATVTETNLNYQGSLTLDEALMRAAGIFPYEQVQVVNLNNGVRLETYVIPGPEGSGVVCLNGAAARLAVPGDKVIIMAYAWVTEEEAGKMKPRVVLVDERNRVVA
ncbi:aspartate 1-decarboxylase [Ammonifex degensii KC4]|uniref:Aspartate 1-decarboxylase n=1 Tax=Ammonifex degensii (strain DSM 10501 / KC4) TaxID=429009 RepID=C9R9H7_AMMDK|nr:aspartate 1-decarboxylase [Ammonifex degensii]ACX52956.1 aspartate 1-decarboxylase [Ammonifex degensii KC4]